MEFQPLSADAVTVRFNRLMASVFEGNLRTNSFQPWEVAILLDIHSCEMPYADRRRTLQRYQRYANRLLTGGAALPPTLTDYLDHCRLRAATQQSARQSGPVAIAG